MSELKQFAEIMESMKAYIDHVEKEAYKRGLDEGKARNEDGCIGCRYDDGTTEHSPCNYCCNAYSNQWSAKQCSDEIKVGDEVEDETGEKLVIAHIDPSTKSVCAIGGDGCTYGFFADNYKKTGKHYSQVEELLEAMKEGAE